MFAQYSPLFTSGLLSDSPSTSRTPSPTLSSHKRNRESLPLTVSTQSISFSDIFDSARSPDGEDNAIFLTFKPHRRQIDHGRSFLSLDLAECSSLRSMSLRRKDTVSTKTTAFFGRSEPSSPSQSSPVSPVEKRTEFLPFAAPPASPAPTLRRHSRETLRLPSPKPAPSINLPEPPAPEPSRRSHRQRPSDLVLTLSACFNEAGPASSSSLSPADSFHRPSYSAPSVTEPHSAPDSQNVSHSPSRNRTVLFLFLAYLSHSINCLPSNTARKRQ
ncbi:hypothetical protein NLI96_g7374 [Meripilus lineatus]|uniref:Uncharacterized protein n=1 Tax=Meripilus lineatus TaxID=2056292 RepID=A0AAD5YC49_9APHY|nr:hypothetical protein NLI96_g7374 [Physisporinus lineatus]